ncbi:hypothetical protein [Oscillibacter sp.]|uniref:hypothetical protein n=1 Tax=Oscillibacter sp. TaxID=1945593 RepID=UPI0028A0208B|nr:hypothetical protein [Oscillibacter sp.]
MKKMIVVPAIPLHYIKAPRFKSGKKTHTGSKPIPLSNPCLSAAVPAVDTSKPESADRQEVSHG